jgi:putative sugar O-methyltransferase
MNKNTILLRQDLIKKIFEDFRDQKKIYKPTIFWENVSIRLYKFFYKNEITNFKRNSLINNFFVPTYNLKKENNILQIARKIKKFKITKKLSLLFKHFVDGKLQAFSDYRVFKTADIPKKFPILKEFTETNFGNPAEQFQFSKKNFSRSSLNYLLGLCFLKRNSQNFIPKITLEIGGGTVALEK